MPWRSDAGQARPGYARQEALGVGRARIGRAIKRGWGEPSNEVGRASTKAPLGEPVLIGRAINEVGRASTIGRARVGRTRIGQAIKRGWGEPSNEVGRASTRWASHSTFTASTPASKRLLGAVPTVPARHIYSDICSAPGCLCLLGTSS